MASVAMISGVTVRVPRTGQKLIARRSRSVAPTVSASRSRTTAIAPVAVSRSASSTAEPGVPAVPAAPKAKAPRKSLSYTGRAGA